MWKPLLAGAAALALVGTSVVYAQQSNTAAPGEFHHRLSAEDRAAFLDARIAGLKTALKLTPDQEKNWPAFEQAYRELAKLRGEQRRAMFERREHADNNVNPVDRLKNRADAVSARGAALKRLADATGPLYQSLDDAQKGRFQLLERMARHQHREHFAFWREHREHHEER
jgi:zinc resistance-associated protein